MSCSRTQHSDAAEAGTLSSDAFPVGRGKKCSTLENFVITVTSGPAQAALLGPI